MKRISKRILALLLALFMLAGTIPVTAISSFAAEETGMTFKTSDTKKWRMGNPLEVLPYTFSFKMKVATDATSNRLGIIFSNYDGGSTGTWHGGTSYGAKTIDLEVHNNGAPRFYFGGDNSGAVTARDLKFTNLDVRTGDWINLTFVKEADKVVCYIIDETGTKSQSIECAYEYHSEVLGLPFVLGSENRSKHQYPFGGAITFLVLFLMGSPYLKWDYSNPEWAVVGVAFHAFEWLFVRTAPIAFIGAFAGIILTRKRQS